LVAAALGSLTIYNRAGITDADLGNLNGRLIWRATIRPVKDQDWRKADIRTDRGKLS
jgi:hypothetical protein